MFVVTRELSAEYLELLLSMLEAAVLASIDTGRFVSQKVAKVAVKPPTWAPAQQKDWEKHVRLKNEQGQTVGFADTDSPVVGRVWDVKGHEVRESRVVPKQGVEHKEDLMLLGGGGFAIREPQELGKMAEATLVNEETARLYAEDELGWQWVDDGQVVTDSSKPVVVHGVSADVDDGQVVVAMNAQVRNGADAEVFDRHGVVVTARDGDAGEPDVYSGWDDRGQPSGELYEDNWSDVLGAEFDPVMDRVEPARYESDSLGWD